MITLSQYFTRSIDYLLEFFTHRERKRLYEKNKKLEQSLKDSIERELIFSQEKNSLAVRIQELERMVEQSNEIVGLYQKQQDELNRRLDRLTNEYNLNSPEIRAFAKLEHRAQKSLLACIPESSSLDPKEKIKLNQTHVGSRCKSRCYLALLERLSHIPFIEKIEDIDAIQTRQSHVKPNHEYIEVVYKSPDRPGGGHRFRVYPYDRKKELVTEMIKQLVL